MAAPFFLPRPSACWPCTERSSPRNQRPLAVENGLPSVELHPVSVWSMRFAIEEEIGVSIPLKISLSSAHPVNLGSSRGAGLFFFSFFLFLLTSFIS